MPRKCRERFTRHRRQRKMLVSDAGMHHGTCVTHVPWRMWGSLIRGDGENVPGIPCACATRNFTYLVRGPCHNDFEMCVHTTDTYHMNRLVWWSHRRERGISRENIYIYIGISFVIHWRHTLQLQQRLWLSWMMTLWNYIQAMLCTCRRSFGFSINVWCIHIYMNKEVHSVWYTSNTANNGGIKLSGRCHTENLLHIFAESIKLIAENKNYKGIQ